MRHPTPAHASGDTHSYRVRTAGDAAELDVASKTGCGCDDTWCVRVRVKVCHGDSVPRCVRVRVRVCVCACVCVCVV